MTESDSINPFEAPKQLPVSTDPTIDDPIRYEATPTINDLNAALRPISGFIFPSIWLALVLFVFLITLASIITSGLGPEYVGEIVLLFGLFCLASLLALGLRSKIYAAKKHLRLNPHATAPLTGVLTNQGLRLESENRISWSAHDGLVSCKVKNNQLSLCHDPQGAVVRILPKRGFHNPGQAVRYLEFQANQAFELEMVEPFSGSSMIGDSPADATAFVGVVKASDLETPPLRKIRKRNQVWLLVWLLVLVAVIIPVIQLAFGSRAMLVSAVSILIVCFLTIRKIRANSNSDPEFPLLAIQGWLTNSEIALLHNIGQARSRWQDFKAVGFDEACIWLQAYGGQSNFVLLPRRFFANDAQWESAVEIAAAHLTE